MFIQNYELHNILELRANIEDKYSQLVQEECSSRREVGKYAECSSRREVAVSVRNVLQEEKHVLYLLQDSPRPGTQ